MTHTTTNLGLTTYNTVEDSGSSIYTYINTVSGSNTNQNLGIIDSFAGSVNASLVTLEDGLDAITGSFVAASVTDINNGDVMHYVSASALAYSGYAYKSCIIPLNTSSALTTNDINYTHIPIEMGNWILDDAYAFCQSPSTSGSINIMISRSLTGTPSWTNMLNSNLVIPQSSYWSTAYADISTTASMVYPLDTIRITNSSAGTSASFVQVLLIFRKMI